MVRWLQTTALAAMTAGQGERDPHDAPFGTTRGSLSTLLLSRSWRYRLSELNTHLINQTDVLTLPLPERLRLLYPVLRVATHRPARHNVRLPDPNRRAHSRATNGIRAGTGKIELNGGRKP